MSVATEISKLQTNLMNAYSTVEEKGATLPANQNFDNLATAISSIPSGGGSQTKYGANINTFLGDVDANGVLQTPTEQSDLVFTGVKDVAINGLAYKFSHSKVKSVSFPALTTISGSSGCLYMLQYCTALTSVSLPALTTISGSSGCSYMLYRCTALTSISFPALTTISGSSGCSFMLGYCTALTDAYFPALTTISFGSRINQFTYMMSYTGTTVTHTLHFPSNMESTISGLSGYPLFGGTSGYVVCAFDLPAT